MTTFFSLIATVIPVLLVAGLLNPVILREYSKNPRQAKRVKNNVNIALVATCVSIFMALFAAISPDPRPVWLSVMFGIASFIDGTALGSVCIFVSFLVEYAVDENPHPDRFEFERRELERRESILRAKRDFHANDDSGRGKDSYY